MKLGMRSLYIKVRIIKQHFKFTSKAELVENGTSIVLVVYNNFPDGIMISGNFDFGRQDDS